jgi:hypothetical protein
MVRNIGALVHFVMGALQALAIGNWLAANYTCPIVVTWTVAAFLGYLPGIGTLLAIGAVVDQYRWPLSRAAVFFVGPYLILFFMILIATLWHHHKIKNLARTSGLTHTRRRVIDLRRGLPSQSGEQLS